MPLTYCVFGEGPNDIGVEEPVSGHILSEGCYSGFVRGIHYDKDFHCLKAVSLKSIKLPGGFTRKADEKLPGFRKKAYYAARMASSSGANMIIIGTDVDRGREAATDFKQRKKALIKYRSEFKEGYEIACKEKPEIKKIRLVVIVPLCKLESWLLADEKAFLKATKIPRGKLPAQPEEMYGENDPKEHLHKILKDKSGTKVFYKIAINSDPDVLEKACPLSYKPFHKQCKPWKDS